MNDPVLKTLVGHLTLSVKQPLRKTPWLDDILLEEGGPKLTADQEKQVYTMLGVAAPSATAKAPPPLPVEQEFNVFQFFDDDDSAGPTAQKSPAGRSSKMLKRPTRSAKKSKLPLLIGGGAVAAVLVIGGIVAAVGLGGKKDPPTQVVQNGGDVTPKPPTKSAGENFPAKIGLNDRWLQFAGRGHVELENSRGLIDLNGTFTAEAWVRWPANLQKHLTIMGDEAWPSIGTALQVPQTCGWVLRTRGLENGENRRFDFTAASGNPEWFGVVSEPVHVAGGQWHHLAVSKTPKLVRIFLDGNPIAERSCEDVEFVTCPTNLYLGVRKDGSPDRWFEGEFKAVRISKRARYVAAFKPEDEFARDASTEVLLDFSSSDAQTIADLSGHGHNGILNDVKWIDADKSGEPIPPAIGSRSAPIAIAALPTGRDYLFIRKDDPALYMTQNGSPIRARELGRHTSPMLALTVAADGLQALTGSEDGEVRIWSLSGMPVGPEGGMQKPIATFQKIDLFGGRFSVDAFDQRVVFHDLENKKSVSVSIGKPGYPVKGAFAGNLKTKPQLPERLGQAVTNEVNLFNGDLIAQVFEGGVQLYSKAVDKTWMAWHARRKPVTESVPPVKNELRRLCLGRRRTPGWSEAALPTISGGRCVELRRQGRWARAFRTKIREADSERRTTKHLRESNSRFARRRGRCAIRLCLHRPEGPARADHAAMAYSRLGAPSLLGRRQIEPGLSGKKVIRQIARSGPMGPPGGEN